MLATDPQKRMKLSKVLSHPWMLRNHWGHVVPRIPYRQVLRFDDLHRDVIIRMSGFGFGSEEEIKAHIRGILSSEPYLKAVPIRERALENINPPSHTLDAMPYHDEALQSTRNKCFSGIVNCFPRKLFPSRIAHLPSPSVQPDIQDIPNDPKRGLHPLISVYVLVKEKMERESANHQSSL